MIKTILPSILLLVPTIASALEENICNKVGEFAYSVMIDRQEGVPLSEAMKGIQEEIDKADVNSVNKEALNKIVFDAYEEIDLSVFPEMAKRAAIEHNNKWTLACYSNT